MPNKHFSRAAWCKKRRAEVAIRFGVDAPFPDDGVHTLWIERLRTIDDWQWAHKYLMRARSHRAIQRWHGEVTKAKQILAQYKSVPQPYISWDHVHAFFDGCPMVMSYVNRRGHK